MHRHRRRSTRSWRRRAGVGLGAALLLLGACSGDGDAAADDATASAEPGEAQTTTTTTIDPSLIAPLTGETGNDATELERSALMVKIDNVEAARPQVGIAAADIVIEEQVEGDQTRLVAVFHSTVPEKIGPVRSTRSTDFDLIPLFGRPVYASSGGNNAVMSNLAAVDQIDVGHNRGGAGFERDGGRPAPHNLIATPNSLFERAGDETDRPPAPIFTFRSPGAALPATAREATSVAVRFGGAEVSRFEWAAGDGVWLRSQRGTPHVDTAGEQLAPVNVVVIQIDYTFGNGVGISNPHGVTTGQGTATVLTDGHVITGTWSRPTAQDPFELVADNGEAIALTPGQTFVELAPTGDTVTVG